MKGLRIAIPADYSILVSAEAYAAYEERYGAWGVLGDPSCGWVRPGSVADPTNAYVDQFVLAAFNNPEFLQSPTRRLLVLRTDRQDLDKLERCEVSLRTQPGITLIEGKTRTVVVGGFRARRLVFDLADENGNRDVLFLVDDGPTLWALNFTTSGADASATDDMSAFNAIAATVRFLG